MGYYKVKIRFRNRIFPRYYKVVASSYEDAVSELIKKHKFRIGNFTIVWVK